MMLCRGEDTRTKICTEFDLKPIAHVKLLAGQDKKSCTGDMLTDSYYCFSYQSKSGGECGTFLCGSHAAKHFLSILKLADLPLFNPLRSGGSDAISPVASTNGKQANVIWNPIAKQLYNAINILVISWSTVPGAALSDVKEKLEKSRTEIPHWRQIKSVNTIISKDKKGRTIQDMLAELSKDNDIKGYDFSLLNQELIAQNISPKFG